MFGTAPGWNSGCHLFAHHDVTGPATPLANVTSGQCPPAPVPLLLRTMGSPASTSGTDSSMGVFTSVSQDWAAGSCAQIRTTIRYYKRHNYFDFETYFTSGAHGTAAVELLHPSLGHSTTGSEFPVFVVQNSSNRGLATWAGNFLGSTEVVYPPPTGWKRGSFVGGRGNGPMVLYSAPTNATDLQPALALSVANHFQSAILSRRADGAVVAGVQGFISSVPKNWTLRVGLAPRRGVIAAMNGLGTALQSQHQTHRLTLDEDPLDKRLGFVQDDGSYYEFEHYVRLIHNRSWSWSFASAEINRSGFRPAAAIMSDLNKYHRSLNLDLGYYHIDGYWYRKYNTSNPSQVSPPDAGGCCENQTADPFQFPSGIKSVGVPMQLFMSHSWGRTNVYGKGAGHPTPWEPNMGKGQYAWENASWGCCAVQSSVTPEASKEFWHERFSQQVTDSNLKASILDQLYCLQSAFAGWMNRTDGISLVQQSYDDAATFFRIPFRVDMHTPSDVMASLIMHL